PRTPEEQGKVAPIGLHRRAVAQVAHDGPGLVALVAPRQRLADHVVREDGPDPRLRRLVDVARDEAAVLVPGRPARAGVDAAGEILVAVAERRVPAHRCRAAGLARKPK